MNLRNEHGLFGALEAELRRSKEPLDCAILFEKAAIREHAETVSRVSDYLGHLWRKGLVLRLPAPKMEGTRARWLYMWKNKGPAKKPVPDLTQAVEYNPHIDQMLTRPNITVSEEDGSVIIDFSQFTIIVKSKS